MKISYAWLKDYVRCSMPPEKLAELLTMSGTEVKAIEKHGSDHRMEIEVTSNRSDCLSLIGIAREIAAATGKKLMLPKTKTHPSKPPARAKRDTPLVVIEDRHLCPRYTARLITSVTVGPSPKWLVERLEAVGLRTVNNVVDVTNFCLLETGEPMHAFDLDRLSGGQIRVRRSRKGERLVTIDGTTRTLNESMLVIADSANPVALAGVMGGKDTEVSPATTAILLEAAIFDPVTIRRTSRALGLSTESSYRFERRIDPGIVQFASDRAASLIVELCGGTIGPIVDAGSLPGKKKTIPIRFERLGSLLGVAVDPGTIAKILSSLGLMVVSHSAKGLSVSVPTFRGDLESEVDLIEEVARIYGYHRIPLSIPRIFEQPVRLERKALVDRSARTLLAGIGLDEIVTYSLVSRRLLSLAGIQHEATVAIANPLSFEQEVMRPRLVPGMLNAIVLNINRGRRDLMFFELGNVYRRGQDEQGASETLRLGIALTGGTGTHWGRKSQAFDIFDVKGILETLCGAIGIDGISCGRGEEPFLSNESSAVISLNGAAIGSLGRVADSVLQAFDIKQDVFIAEIDFESIVRSARPEKIFARPAVYPSVARDVSLIIDRGVTNDAVVALIRREGQGLVTAVGPFDHYTGKQIPDGKKSLAYRVEYQDPTRTLEDAQVNAVHAKICEALTREIGAILR